MLADRQRETVAAFLGAIPEHLRRTIERACTDMHEDFVRAIEEEVPWAEIVIDRFSVARAYRDGADTVCKTEFKRLKRALPKTESAALQGAMWPCRKRPADLTPQAGATCAIRAWRKRVQASGLAECENVLDMIDRWMDGITNDFQGRQTSGLVEGFNNHVNVLKRRCYGIFNVGTLFQRLTFDLHGYQRFGHP